MKSKTALRQLLILLQCLVLLLATFSFDIPTVQAASLSRGAVLGSLSDTSIKFWVRTDAAGTFQIEYKTSAGAYPGTFSSIASTSSGDDYTNVVSITGLTANTSYDYRVYVDGVLSGGTGSSGTFTTMKTSGVACNYKFSLTGDLSFDQVPYNLLTSAAAKTPLFSVFPGDQIYGPGSGTKSSLEGYYQNNWGESTLRTFLKSIPGFFIWDDHELFNSPSGAGNDWDGGKSQDYNISRTVYQEYQNSVNPTPLVPGETFYKFTVCDTSFFVADGRSYRSPESAMDSSNNDMFGTSQAEHIKSWLLNDTATIKFLVSPDPWPDNVANGNDSYRGYDNERQEMYRFIKQNNITNVFILSGDQHNEVLYKTDLSNVNKLYEFSATPVGSSVQTADASLSAGGSTKVCINATQSKHYGTIDVDTTVSPAQVTFKAYNSADSIVCNQTITLTNSGPATPTLSSAANQTFNVGQASTTMSTMTITDAATATITTANDIRIRIPSTVDMIWDTSVATATIGGAASAKVSGASVTFEDSSKTAVINVTTNLAAGDVVTIAGLKFKNFNSATAKTNLGIDVANDGGSDSTDSKTIEILPSSGAAIYTAKNHAFNVSQATQTVDTITVVDGSTPAITATNGIRVKIPASFNMTWDATDTTATIGGAASGKVSTTVSYADSDKTLVLNVTSDFVAGDYITIDGLSLKSFSGSSTATNFGVDTNNDSASDATDVKSMKIEAATTKVWTGLGNDKLWSNRLNWSGQAVPVAGDAVLFDGTSTTDCIVDYAAINLYSITLDALYTGTVRYTPYASEGSLGVLTLTGGLTVNGGTMIFEGDSHIDSDSSTPAVNDGTGYVITSPSITVGSGGTISANAEGFEQGVGPAHGGQIANAGGTGGSYGGVGGYPFNAAIAPSSPYGSATSPLSLGSGGGFDGSVSNTVTQNGAGGAGGGALKFNVSGTMSVAGTVSANGENATTGTNGNNRYGAGAGGSIWINAATVSGAGSITANGGTTSGTDAASSHTGGDGGGGRISFGSSTYSFSGSVQVNGGAVATTYASTGTAGHAGTVSFPSAALANFTVSNALTLGNDISYTFGNLTIASGGTLTFDSNLLTGTGATIAATNITIDNGGTLSVNGKGYHSGDANAPGLGTGGSSARGSGGGYGGRGGDTNSLYAGFGGGKYGSATAPVSLGSGGTKVSADGAGGGALKINLSGTMTVNGTFSADGNAAGSNASERGAGSGGSLWVNGGSLAGSGTIRANGGAGGSAGGAGGGGRIALGVTSNTFSGVYQVSGGARSTTSHSGYAGTISFPTDTDLVVGGAMTLGNDIAYTFHTITINSGGTLTLDIDPTGDSNRGTGTTITTGNLTVASGGSLTTASMGHVDTTGTVGQGATGTSNRVGGAGHAGAGGAGSSTYGTPAGGASYDSSANPINPGAGCNPQITCSAATIARGGGAMTINVKNNFVHNGTISANATANSPSAGGSLNFTVKNWSGTTGTMTATGGSVSTGSGGGSGGLIKIDYVNKTYTGTAPSAAGGTSTGANPGTSGAAGIITQNAVSDTSAPTVTSVAVTGITATSATVTWLTDEAGSTYVDYGATSGYGSSTTETDTGTRVLTHTSTITGLTGSTTYHFSAKSKDDAGTPNIGASTDATFTTLAAPDTTAPVVSNIVATPTHNSVQITWDTDEASSSFIDYGTTGSYGTTTSEIDTSPRVTSHTVNITGLTAATTYHFRTNSKDVATNNGQSTDQTFTTSAAPDVTPPVISSVAAAPGGISVTINWTTDEIASSIVEYGPTISYGTTTSETDTSPRVTSHEVTISGLSEQTTYHFRVKSKDASTNLATGTDNTFTTTDITAPIISSIVASPTHNSVQITWNTNELASTFVDYGATASYGTTTSETDTSPRVTSHSVTISGLTPTTTYHFKVSSNDASANLSESLDQTFTTDAAPDVTAPVISNLVATPTDTSVTITWDTDEVASSLVDYGTTGSYGSSTSETNTSPRVTSHSVTITGLTASTGYHYRVVSTDAATNTVTGTDHTFTTDATPDLVAPVISAINTTPSVATAIIEWLTDEVASSFLEYGLTSSYGSTSPEIDTSPRVLSHSVTLSGLSALTTYHFRVNSNDASSNLGQSSDQTFITSPTPDTTAPIITNVAATPTDTSVQITWDTDEAASSIVEYGTTLSYGTTTAETDTSPRVTSHNVTISGLSASTGYHFRVKSADAATNLRTGNDTTFTTGASSGGGGGGGSFGGGYIQSVIPPAIIVLPPVTPPTTETLPPKPTTIVFTKDMKTNYVGDDVVALQKILNNNGYLLAKTGPGSKGKETNKFGKATRQAVAQFQKKYKITPYNGSFGPKTRAKMNELIKAGKVVVK